MKFISMKTMSLLTAAALTLSLASCGTTQTTATDAQTQTETTVTQSEPQTTQNDQQTNQTQENTTQSNAAPGGRKDFQQQGGTFGRVTAIDGDTVTVEVRQMGGRMGGRMGGGRMMNPPDFNGGNSDNQQTPPDLPADSGDNQQTPPDMTQDDSTQTITLTLSQITKDGAAVTADDVSVDTFLMITMDENGSPVSATIAEGFGCRMGGQMDGGQNGGRMNGGGMKGQRNDQTTDGNSAPTAPADNTAQSTDNTNA